MRDILRTAYVTLEEEYGMTLLINN